MKHPFEFITVPGQKGAFVALFLLTVIVMVSLQISGGPLRSEAAPGGIISFEFAGDLANAQAMVASWGAEGRIYAGLNLGLDYLFIISYVGAIGLGCVAVARALARRIPSLVTLGVILAWAQICAGLLDSVENYALIQVLLGSEATFWPPLARWCAIPKFLMVASGLIYVVVGAALIVVKPKASGEETAS